MHYFVHIFFFDFCGFISVAYTTLNKLLAVFLIYNHLIVVRSLQANSAKLANQRLIAWQGLASYMHLPLARLVSMSVIFCLLPSSSIIIIFLYCHYCAEWGVRVLNGVPQWWPSMSTFNILIAKFAMPSVCELHVSVASHYCLLSIIRPTVRSNGRSSVLPVMFFFFFSPRVLRVPSTDRPETLPSD